VAQWARYRTRAGVEGFGRLNGAQIECHRGELFDAPLATGECLSLAEVVLQVPCHPTKIVALWNNFHALAAKLGKQAPSHPLYLFKSTSSLLGNGAPIVRPKGYGGKIVFEGELCIVIGKICRGLDAKAAASHIFGYTCINDVTAIDLLSENPDFAQWTRCKGFDTFGAVGPVIANEIDLVGAHVVTRVDGVERQNYALSDMIFPPAELVARISHDLTLLPGDLIACGTSLGVGSIKDGATVEVSIDGIGTLSNTLTGI
jgi:2-keto-4-pentenoate hydratase/2-oxohepta-3-ene-1,7-dioic acid hydratase in catechol pathway